MQTIKRGFTFLTFFLITTMLLFIGISVVRVCSTHISITLQHTQYWVTYYKHEAFLEYMYAYWCNNQNNMPATLDFDVLNDSYLITIHKKNNNDEVVILHGHVAHHHKTVAQIELVLKKRDDEWVVFKRTAT